MGHLRARGPAVEARLLFLLGVMAVLLLFSIGTVRATEFVNQPLGRVVGESSNIVRGIVGDSYSDWGRGGHRQIYTYTELTVTDIIKGKMPDREILLRQPGGSVDGMAMSVPGAASFKRGEDVVVLLGKKNKDDGSYNIPGFSTGKYMVKRDENGDPILINSLGGSEVYNPNKDPSTMSYNSTIPLKVFRRVVRDQASAEAAQKQYKPSTHAPTTEPVKTHKPPPVAVQPKPYQPPKAPITAQTPVDKIIPHNAKRGPLWIILSFAVLVIGGLALVWSVLRGKKG